MTPSTLRERCVPRTTGTNCPGDGSGGEKASCHKTRHKLTTNRANQLPKMNDSPSSPSSTPHPNPCAVGRTLLTSLSLTWTLVDWKLVKKDKGRTTGTSTREMTLFINISSLWGKGEHEQSKRLSHTWMCILIVAVLPMPRQYTGLSEPWVTDYMHVRTPLAETGSLPSETGCVRERTELHTLPRVKSELKLLTDSRMGEASGKTGVAAGTGLYACVT